MPRYDFDMFTIGAGSGGVASSRRAGSYGARVAICEESRVGGTCVIRGCVPKKLLVYGAQFADAFATRRLWLEGAAAEFRLARADRGEGPRDRAASQSTHMLNNSGVEIIEGRGVLVDPHTVEIATDGPYRRDDPDRRRRASDRARHSRHRSGKCDHALLQSHFEGARRANKESGTTDEKPTMIYTGGGVILSDAATQLTELVRMLGFPCTNTLMGLGGYPATDPKFLGMLGMHGTYEANMAMQHCDVLVAVGARFDDRVIGNPKHFSNEERGSHPHRY